MKLRTFNSTITGFTTNNGALTVYFDRKDNPETGMASYKKALAHPALQVKPHIGVAQEIKILETEQGWKMIKPYPTKEEIATYEQAKAEREALQASVTEASKEDLALLTF
jgi:hypothetical protein